MNIERVKLKDGSVYPVSPAWFEGTEYGAQMSNIDYEGVTGTYVTEETKSNGDIQTMEMPFFKFTDHVMTKEELSAITISDIDCVVKPAEALKDNSDYADIYAAIEQVADPFSYGLRLPRAIDVETSPLGDSISFDYAAFGTDELSVMIISIPDDVVANSPIVIDEGDDKLTITVPEAGTYATSPTFMYLTMLSAEFGVDFPLITYDLKFTVSNGKFHFDNRYLGGSAIVDVCIDTVGSQGDVICKILDRTSAAEISNASTNSTLLSVTIPLTGREYVKQALTRAIAKRQYIHLMYEGNYEALFDSMGAGQMIAVTKPSTGADSVVRTYLGIQTLDVRVDYNVARGSMKMGSGGTIQSSYISIVNETQLEASRPTENDIVLVYNGTSWKNAADFSGAAVDIIALYGLSCTTAPSYGDKLIVCVYDPEVSTTGTIQASDVAIDKSVYKTKAGNFSKEFSYDGTKWTLLGATDEADLSTYGITISESATPASGDKITVAVQAYKVEKAPASSLTEDSVSIDPETFGAYTNELQGSIVFVYYYDGWHKTNAAGTSDSDINSSTDQGLVDLSVYGITIEEGHTPAYKDAMQIEGGGNCITLSVKRLI